MRSLIISVGLLTVMVPALAADFSALDDRTLAGNSRYDRCLSLTQRNASLALGTAVAWQGNGGDGAATHCAALALVALRRYPEAAARLDQLGHENLGSVAGRAALFDQAGNAWLLAHRGPEAIASFTSALALAPRDPDLLADRARAAALIGDWKSAEADLTAALSRDASRADFLVLRASARHALGRKPEASADLDQALRIVPNYAEALVERGALKLEAGDTNGARADWQTVVARAPNSTAAQSAQEHLREMPPPSAK